MCPPDPNRAARQQAKIENQRRRDEYYMQGLQFFNKETAYVRGIHAIGMAESRDRGDAFVQALYNIGTARKATEKLISAYSQKQSVDEGGRSTGFGKTTLAKLHAQKAEIESSLENMIGFGQAQTLEGLKRMKVARVRNNRDKLGLPPSFGPPVYDPGPDKAGQAWGAFQTGLQIASMGISAFNTFKTPTPQTDPNNIRGTIG
mgnify:CR=1 FL=1